MAFVSVYFGLGSNLGNRLDNLEAALSMLDDALGSHYQSLSKIIETSPWGFDSSDKFLNCCVLYRIYRKGTPEQQGLELLAICQDIEKKLGRKEKSTKGSDGKPVYHNRTIDIDILFYGSERIDLPELQVPHPLMAERPFVMIPLTEIAKPSLKAAFPELFQ